MQIIFKANDGTMFDTAEACAQYEVELTNKPKDWQAWGWSGRPTDKTANAIVVKFLTDEAAAQFLTAADLEDDGNVGGINEYSQGWYYYDECAEQYFRIDEAIVDILKNISAS